MNSIKLHLIYLVLMCVGLCPRVAVAENNDASGNVSSFKYREIKSVKIFTTQENMEYTVGLYSFNLASEKQRQHLIPYAFLFSQKEDHTDWWFAVKYTIENTNMCSHSYNVNGNNSYGGVVDQANKLEFFLDLELDKTGNPFDTKDKDKIIRTLRNDFEEKTTEDSHESSSAQPQGIEAVLTRLFDGCSEFPALDELADELEKKNIEKLASGEKITKLENNIFSLKKDLKEEQNKLKSAEAEKTSLQEQLNTANSEIKKVRDELEKAKSDSNDWKKWLQIEALNGLLMIVIVVLGFLLYRKVAQRFDEKMEGYHTDTQPRISDDMHNFKNQQVETLVINKKIYRKLKKAPIGNNERMALNYQNTDAEQANTLLSTVQTTQKAASEKLTAHIEQQFQDQSEESIARGKEYNDKLETLRLDMQKQLKDAKADQKQAMATLLSAVETAQKAALAKLNCIDQQIQNFISENKEHEQLRLKYDKEKDSRLNMEKQLEHAKAGQKQERERFLRLKDQVDNLKKISVRIYQQGGLKLSDEESENLTLKRLAELASWYRKNLTVRQYGLAINALKESLGDSALTDESFFKAVGLNKLKEELNQIKSFLEFYESDDLSEFLLGHWREYIKLIFSACLLLESYFQLDMQNPVLIDLQLARNVATKLLWEHGLIPDDFQLPVPSYEFERKFEVTVHGDIPADLAAHAGFKDKVQALRRSGAHKVVCYVIKWGLSAQAGAPYTHDLPGTVLKSLERLDPVVQGWGD